MGALTADIAVVFMTMELVTIHAREIWISEAIAVSQNYLRLVHGCSEIETLFEIRHEMVNVPRHEVLLGYRFKVVYR